ncbi:MAG: hypothetical protein KDJ38_17040, partial [Gammaproteobacteria bacterium]|nr:hypothetical protein [Gammaproteobacteria bacterium]
MNSKIIIAILALAGLLGGLTLSWLGERDSPAQLQSRLTTATLLPADLKRFPDITLTDQHGQPFTRE